MIYEFENLGFRVINLLTEYSEIEDTNFDLVWIHHAPVFYEICIAKKIKSSMVIFCSLSFFEPLEAVPEHREAIDILLANSIENRNFIINELELNRDQVLVFPNAVPRIYWTRLKKFHTYKLNSIAIISNHPALEVLEAMATLKEDGINVARFGKGGAEILINPDLLLNFDAVITIGKTVPYCFALKVPVYCYDHFGGPGWLNEDNFDLASQNNFSGRGFARKTSEIIAQEITNGYQESIVKLDVYRNHAMNFHDLGKNIELLLGCSRTPKRKKSSSMIGIQTIKLHAQYMRLAKVLSAREAEIDAYNREITRIKSTFSWRLTAPFRFAYNSIRRIIGKD